MSFQAHLDRRPWRPEDGDGRCQQCGGLNPVWYAPNDLWNQIVGGEAGILCPTCFLLIADAHHAHDITVWQIEPRR